VRFNDTLALSIVSIMLVWDVTLCSW